MEIYKKHGIKAAFINIGGNVVTLGNKPNGIPWSVGIRNPRPEGDQSGQIVGTVKVTDKAVVTAGDDSHGDFMGALKEAFANKFEVTPAKAK